MGARVADYGFGGEDQQHVLSLVANGVYVLVIAPASSFDIDSCIKKALNSTKAWLRKGQSLSSKSGNDKKTKKYFQQRSSHTTTIASGSEKELLA